MVTAKLYTYIIAVVNSIVDYFAVWRCSVPGSVDSCIACKVNAAILYSNIICIAYLQGISITSFKRKIVECNIVLTVNIYKLVNGAYFYNKTFRICCSEVLKKC
jgi:hypothetical protein